MSNLAYNSPAGSLNDASLLNKKHLFAPKTQGRGLKQNAFLFECEGVVYEDGGVEEKYLVGIFEVHKT